MTGVLRKTGNLKAHREKPCEVEGRDWEYQSLPANHQKPPEGTNHADTLIPDFWRPEVQDNKFLLFKPPSSWYFAIENKYGSIQGR